MWKRLRLSSAILYCIFKSPPPVFIINYHQTPSCPLLWYFISISLTETESVSVFCVATLYSSSDWNLPSATKQSSVCVCVCMRQREREREGGRDIYPTFYTVNFLGSIFFIEIYKSYEIHPFYFTFLNTAILMFHFMSVNKYL